MILEMTRPVQGGLRQERKLEGVSNNLANVDTVGYKKDVISFDREFKAALTKDFAQGDFRQTGNAFDLALTGEGFFKIDTPDGIQYTRNGNFNLSREGILVDNNGNPVLGQAGAIAFDLANDPGTGPEINEDGEIRLNGDLIDTLDIVTFADVGKLEKTGKNLMEYTGPTTDELVAEGVQVHQRVLESSNVQAVEEMVKMIDYHRMFETFTKSMLTFDEVDAKIIGEVGKVS